MLRAVEAPSLNHVNHEYDGKVNAKTQVTFLDGATFDVPDFLPEEIGAEIAAL